MAPLPYEITALMIQCFGRSFHYKDNMAMFLLNAGADRSLVDKYRDEPKFVWARRVLTELGQTEEGRLTQRRILTELCRLRNLPDRNVPDRDAGLSALRELKKVALEHDLITRQEVDSRREKRRDAERKLDIVKDRAAKLASLRERFSAGVIELDRQKAGFSLEDILRDLFALSEIGYRKSYKTATQQIDGHFRFEGFDYLVEARWRKNQPTEQEIGGFKHKVDSKLESTRGLFLSVVGFRAEVVEQFNGKGANIILVDGEHLTHILEGRMDLGEGLRILIEKAAQEGIVYAKFFE